jgi:putative SOS response-associated peptidase YedK
MLPSSADAPLEHGPDCGQVGILGGIGVGHGLPPEQAKELLGDQIGVLRLRPPDALPRQPVFRAAFKARRCLIPASGYYEWKHEGKAKRPHFIHPRDGGLFAFAGLWDVWAKGAAPVESCSIITTTANEATRHLHERMPVILDREHFAAWLDPLTPQPALHELLRPCPPERIALHPVGAAVGNVRNDGPGLVAPAADLFTA